MASRSDMKPKEAAGWAGLALAGWGVYKVIQWWNEPDEDDLVEALKKEALARWNYYKSFEADAQFQAIAKKWQNDNNKKLPASGATPSALEVLVGADVHKNQVKIAKDIYASKGFWGNDETKLYHALQGMKSLAGLWAVAHDFKSLYKGSMFAYIGSFTSDDDKIEIVRTILDKLPYYYGGKQREIPSEVKLPKKKKKKKVKKPEL